MKKTFYSILFLVVMSGVSFSQSYSPIYGTKIEAKNGTFKLTFDQTSIANSFTLKWPSAIGSNGQSLSLIDGAGQLGWVTPLTLSGANIWTAAQTFRNNPVAIDNNNNTAQELRFYEPSTSGSDYTSFKAQAQSGNVNYTLPPADGTSGQALTTNGSGSLIWSTISGGGGGGSAPVLKDNNTVTLGTILTIGNNAITVMTSTGHIVIIRLTPEGGHKFPINQIYWTAASCTGTPYLNDGNGGTPPFDYRYHKMLCYSGQTGTLYSMSAPNADGASLSVSFTAVDLENPLCGANAGTRSGWALTAQTPGSVGLPATIAYPLTIQ